MRRSARIPEHAGWRAVQTPAGLWIVVDETGRDIFRQPFALDRLYAAHLGAQAPALRATLGEIVRRVRSLELNLDARDRFRFNAAEAAIASSRPPVARILEALRAGEQGELDLEEFDRAA